LQCCPSHIQLILATTGMKWHSSAPTTVPAKSSTRSGKNCDKRHRIINWIRKEVSVLGSSGGNNVFIAIRHFNDREVSGQMIRSLQLWLPISCSLELSSCQGLADAPEKNPQFQQHLDLLMSGPSVCQSCFTTANDNNPKHPKTSVTSGSLSFFHQPSPKSNPQRSLCRLT